MEGIFNLARIFYKWVIDTNEYQNDVNTWETYLDMTQGAGGLSYLFLTLIVISLVTAVIFYYGIAKNVSAATKKNYVVVCLMGLVTLLVFNFVVAFVGCEWSSCLSSWNMWKICLIDILYYFILFEIWSLLIKGKSNAETIDWISIIFGK